MDKDRISYLFKQYITDKCTTAEEAEFKRALTRLEGEEQLKELLDEVWVHLDESKFTDLNSERAVHLIENIIDQPQRTYPRNFPFLRIAVAVAILLSFGFFLWYGHKASITVAPLAAVIVHDTLDVKPGSGTAILTLANGTPVNLDSEKNGLMVKGDQITYEDGTQLLNNVDRKGLGFLKLETPLGGEYQLLLEDGTKVRINASSILRYPAHFSKDSPREVELEGEAFFEVAQAKNWPFIVKSTSQEVEVLGTSFNVASYRDDGCFKTTLLNGSVRVWKIGQGEKAATPALLKPGQQSIVRADVDKILLSNVDLNEIMAWKEGLFVFNDEGIKSMMKRLARWYNIEVLFEGNVDHVKFQGNYSRHKTLKNLLKNIELTGAVKFKIEDNGTNKPKKVFVMGT
ncbi:FecR family protein [bacterium A37T11]|nr:FecR family protein [bacterium A37T11]